MEPNIVLVGQSPAYQVREGEQAQINLTLALGQQACYSPITYRGTVVDKETGKPVAGAYVTLRSGPYLYRSRTLRDGRFEMTLPCHWSAVSIEVSKEGYSARFIGLHILEQPNDIFYI